MLQPGACTKLTANQGACGDSRASCNICPKLLPAASLGIIDVPHHRLIPFHWRFAARLSFQFPNRFQLHESAHVDAAEKTIPVVMPSPPAQRATAFLAEACA